jgi:hypothetical protein
MLWVRISIRARCTALCDKVCQWLVTGRWFSPGTPISSTNRIDRHDIAEILLKVALNTIKQTNNLRTSYAYYVTKKTSTVLENTRPKSTETKLYIKMPTQWDILLVFSDNKPDVSIQSIHSFFDTFRSLFSSQYLMKFLLHLLVSFVCGISFLNFFSSFLSKIYKSKTDKYVFVLLNSIFETTTILFVIKVRTLFELKMWTMSMLQWATNNSCWYYFCCRYYEIYTFCISNSNTVRLNFQTYINI